MTSPGTCSRLLTDCLRDRWRLSVAVVSTLVLSATQLYLTWLIKAWVEGPLKSGNLQTLRSLLLSGTFALGGGVVALFLSRYITASVNQRVVEQLRNRAVEQLLTLEPRDLRRHPSGDLMSRLLNDASLLSGFLNVTVRRVSREVLVGAGALTLLFILKWQLALVACALAPLSVWLLVRLGAIIRQRGARAQAELGSLGATFNEQLHGFSTIKGYQTETFELERFMGRNVLFRRKVLQGELWSAILLAAVFLASGVGVVVILWYGTVQLTTGAISQGTLLAFCLYGAQVIEPLRRLSEIHASTQISLAAAARVYALIDLPRSVAQPGLQRTGAVSGEVRFEHVTFAYQEREAVLNDVSFCVAAREQVALVGATGDGKTTIASLLVRFYDPQQGRVQLDGVDLCDWSPVDLRRAVVVVEQEPFLFSGPLADNIRYGSWEAPASTVESAVGLVGLGALAASLPKGLQSELSEAGRELSGGEKQRIALARALVRDPAVLVLDEATSAIDSQTEALMFGQLESWLARRTVIAISHRLATATRFRRVIVLQNGAVVGDGSVSELRATCPPFLDLFAGQLDPSQRSGPTTPPLATTLGQVR